MQFVQIIQSSKDACIVRNASHNNFLVDYDLLDFLGLLLSWIVKILSIHFEMSELAFTYHHHLINIDYHHFNIYLNYWRCDSLQKKNYSHFKKIYLISRNFYWNTLLNSVTEFQTQRLIQVYAQTQLQIQRETQLKLQFNQL